MFHEILMDVSKHLFVETLGMTSNKSIKIWSENSQELAEIQSLAKPLQQQK